MSTLVALDDTVVAAHEGAARVVLEYTRTMKELVDAAKAPGFATTGWEPLARFVDVERFERVGPFKDAMAWQSYVDFLTAWATRSYWECSFKRVTQADNVVFLELEERRAPGDTATSVNSLSAYELDDNGRIVHLDVYLQMAPPSPPS